MEAAQAIEIHADAEALAKAIVKSMLENDPSPGEPGPETNGLFGSITQEILRGLTSDDTPPELRDLLDRKAFRPQLVARSLAQMLVGLINQWADEGHDVRGLTAFLSSPYDFDLDATVPPTEAEGTS
jgi:hypothetical protein